MVKPILFCKDNTSGNLFTHWTDSYIVSFRIDGSAIPKITFFCENLELELVKMPMLCYRQMYIKGLNLMYTMHAMKNKPFIKVKTVFFSILDKIVSNLSHNFQKSNIKGDTFSTYMRRHLFTYGFGYNFLLSFALKWYDLLVTKYS